jgi:hypothetical protein
VREFRDSPSFESAGSGRTFTKDLFLAGQSDLSRWCSIDKQLPVMLARNRSDIDRFGIDDLNTYIDQYVRSSELHRSCD